MNNKKIGRFLNLRIVQLIARLILGGTFIYASLDKIAFPQEFAKIVINYNILPKQMATYFAFILPWIELFLGISLIVSLFIRESALALSSLLLVFISAQAVNFFSGEIENCGCFSRNSFLSSSNIIVSVIRDAFLLLCGILLIIANRTKA